MKINPEIAEIIGISIGDGCLSTKNEYMIIVLQEQRLLEES